MSFEDAELPTVTRKYLPTYRVRPEKEFRVDVANRMIKEILEEIFPEQSYTTDQLKSMSLMLNNRVRKALHPQANDDQWPRYKIVVNVYAGEKKEQGVRIASRALWNSEFDRQTSQFIKRDKFYVGVVVFASYTE
eukprot:g2828.t1